ncbi:hypothetical protein BJ508DRAFT_329134 [Ascobolus immersus RN42]|uniref:Uncharacterized protein n=1 Tax=Ascobolus immersus RN42 TaxID=1160509 RepID=A0A3N4HXT8_ASCIM|nr:hypothetical protein BJ508DRAFT_329134 [Ascobolus immersus RN42]
MSDPDDDLVNHTPSNDFINRVEFYYEEGSHLEQVSVNRSDHIIKAVHHVIERIGNTFFIPTKLWVDTDNLVLAANLTGTERVKVHDFNQTWDEAFGAEQSLERAFVSLELPDSFGNPLHTAITTPPTVEYIQRHPMGAAAGNGVVEIAFAYYEGSQRYEWVAEKISDLIMVVAGQMPRELPDLLLRQHHQDITAHLKETFPGIVPESRMPLKSAGGQGVYAIDTESYSTARIYCTSTQKRSPLAEGRRQFCRQQLALLPRTNKDQVAAPNTGSTLGQHGDASHDDGPAADKSESDDSQEDAQPEDHTAADEPPAVPVVDPYVYKTDRFSAKNRYAVIEDGQPEFVPLRRKTIQVVTPPLLATRTIDYLARPISPAPSLTESPPSSPRPSSPGPSTPATLSTTEHLPASFYEMPEMDALLNHPTVTNTPEVFTLADRFVERCRARDREVVSELREVVRELKEAREEIEKDRKDRRAERRERQLEREEMKGEIRQLRRELRQEKIERKEDFRMIRDDIQQFSQSVEDKFGELRNYIDGQHGKTHPLGNRYLVEAIREIACHEADNESYKSLLRINNNSLFELRHFLMDRLDGWDPENRRIAGITIEDFTVEQVLDFICNPEEPVVLDGHHQAHSATRRELRQSISSLDEAQADSRSMLISLLHFIDDFHWYGVA